MTIFNFLTLLGSLSLFLFGMSVMGTALEKRAGGSLKAILAKLTNGKFSGLLTGLAVTAVIQSSSATTVMVVGFVNSGLLSLKQSIPVIMGANIGTTVTAWLLSLSGISGDSLFVQLLKPSSFTPVLAVIGIILYLTAKGKKKDTGLILLGFATLMFGMESLSGSVSGLRDDPNFTKFFLLFSNPILGVLAGAILTGIVQSSSASVGILQALSSTGAVSYGAAIPIIMGQNIGTCVTAMLSSVGTNKNARRAAVVHLSFNIIGTVVWLTVFETANLLLHFSFVDQPIDTFQIAVTHSIFNVLCTLMLLPCCGLLEKLSKKNPASTSGKGKVVSGYAWYYAAKVSDADAKNLKQGNSVKLRFSQISQDVSATIQAVRDDESNDSTLVIFQSEDMDVELVSMREQVATVVVDSYAGLKVPKSAVRMENDEMGVYVLSNSVASYKKIDPLYEGSDFYIVKQNVTGNDSLVVNDDIIVEAKDVNDKKVMK